MKLNQNSFGILDKTKENDRKKLHTFEFARQCSILKINTSGFQSGLETAPLAAVSAGYCHFLGQIQAKSRTDRDIS